MVIQLCGVSLEVVSIIHRIRIRGSPFPAFLALISHISTFQGIRLLVLLIESQFSVFTPLLIYSFSELVIPLGQSIKRK